ncbi:MAG: SGNH/GDSL hydrolase family protein [Bacteroidetes bacterium]|nr:SGNH/GDSL hydrolase family protein [Bacteroidota bacterium]
MYFRILNNIIIMFLVLMFFSCSGGDAVKNKVVYNSIKDVSVDSWKELSTKNIYFGHQSVGSNIIDGIKDLMNENKNIKLRIVELSDDIDLKGGMFIHSRIGKNHEPVTKLDAFSKILESDIGKKIDIAMFKFCYVDVTDKTNITQLFENYRKTIKEIKQKHPSVKVIMFTVPLQITSVTYKTKFKQMTGIGDLWEYKDNLKRNQFNKMIISEFSDNELIFDIASYEAMMSDHNYQTFEFEKKKYFSLNPEYTNDGSHLNELGRKKIAEDLLLELVNI